MFGVKCSLRTQGLCVNCEEEGGGLRHMGQAPTV